MTTKLDSMNARAHELARLAETGDLASLVWWGRKHLSGGSGFAYAVERLLADPKGEGGQVFAAMLDQFAVFLAALQDAKGGD